MPIALINFTPSPLALFLIISGLSLMIFGNLYQRQQRIKKIIQRVCQPPIRSTPPVDPHVVNPSFISNLLTTEHLTQIESLYQPIGSWTGRLILPEKSQRQPDGAVFLEVQNAPPEFANLIGQITKLSWLKNPLVTQFLRAVTTDINFVPLVYDSQASGHIHPTRLNHWQQVGPLESLAGMRDQDDVIVMLPEPVEIDANQNLFITAEPIQITGQEYALIKIIARVNTDDLPRQTLVGVGDKFLVRHYNLATGNFDGLSEIIIIPQGRANRQGVHYFTNNQIEDLPDYELGFYIYGKRNADRFFVVEAIEPRACLNLEPDLVISDHQTALDYLIKETWRETIAQKGKIKKVFLRNQQGQEGNDREQLWQEGDRAIVLHTFGGVGGKNGDKVILGTVTGHFSYGMATVKRDRFTNQLRFDIEYWQMYGHNTDGIISGAIKWHSFLGDLQRGWLGTRPICDIICDIQPVVQDYHFGEITLSPLIEFQQEVAIMMARYRTGDGTGASLVTPASSCVQDSHQALFLALKRTSKEVQNDPKIQAWLKANPDSKEAIQLTELRALVKALQKQLVPLGIVRSDWQTNLHNLVATNTENPRGLFSKIITIIRALISWRTIFPRRAQDEVAAILLKKGASLWMLRTNQIGGFDRTIYPLAPTALLGHRIS